MVKTLEKIHGNFELILEEELQRQNAETIQEIEGWKGDEISAEKAAGNIEGR